MGLQEIKYNRWQKQYLIAKRQCHVYTMNLWDMEDDGTDTEEYISTNKDRNKFCTEIKNLENSNTDFKKQYENERDSDKETDLSKRYNSSKTIDLNYNFITDKYD